MSSLNNAFVVAILAAAGPVLGQPTIAATPPAFPSHDAIEVVELGIRDHTQHVFELGASAVVFGSQFTYLPPATIVAPGAEVILRPSPGFGQITQVDWYRDGTLLASSQPELVLDDVSSHDNGRYYARMQGHSEFPVTRALNLHVGIADQHRLINLSTRVKLTANSATATFGFVIEPPIGGSFLGQEMLIRVVGPGLAPYGVEQPLADPEMALRSVKTGNAVGLGFTQIVFDDGTTPESRYHDRVQKISAAVGAFPIDASLPFSRVDGNRALLMSLPAGAYTLTVNSKSGATGDVLVEVYEVRP